MTCTLVLQNSSVASFAEAREIVLPYLDHFGVAYELCDIFQNALPRDLAERPLIVVAQRGLDPRARRLGAAGMRLLAEAIGNGAGLVSFDPSLPITHPITVGRATPAGEIMVADAGHPITACHTEGETFALGGLLTVPPLDAGDAAVLLKAGNQPLLTASRHGNGRIVRWASIRWADTSLLGALAGLDDILWRGIVWAARKPFALRAAAPLVTMRVDDVAGTWGRYGQTPLGWARAAARNGFLPWLGLFLYNLDDAAIAEVREMLETGQATAFPHALGRPPRKPNDTWFYAADAMPPRATTYDEFIYFDHEHGRPWSDAEAARSLAAVETWYTARQMPSISSYAVAHWYEMGVNVIEHLTDRWGVEFIGKVQEIDAPLRDETPWIKLGPFRRYERPGTALFNPALRGDRPIYYADFVQFANRRLFNCVTEIRDDAGYEWAPDADVAASAARGIRQLRRSFDSLALPVLFTHETDFIHKIPPAEWEATLARIAAGIADYSPIAVTLDAAVRYIRAMRTGRLINFASDIRTGGYLATLTGSTDVATHVRVFTSADEAMHGEFIEIPPFDRHIAIPYAL